MDPFNIAISEVSSVKSFTSPRFACADQNFDVSMNGQIRFMKEVVPWLEQEDIIEKYAWFSTSARRKSGLNQEKM